MNNDPKPLWNNKKSPFLDEIEKHKKFIEKSVESQLLYKEYTKMNKEETITPYETHGGEVEKAEDQRLMRLEHQIDQVRKAGLSNFGALQDRVRKMEDAYVQISELIYKMVVSLDKK